LAWRCLECGSGYEAHYPFCARCWRSGSIVPQAHRARAAVDSQPGQSNARDIAKMRFRLVEQTAYPRLELGARALLLLSGPPGSGKSSAGTRLVDSMNGPVVYLSSEEGIGPALSARLLRCGVARDSFHVLTRATVDQVVQFVRDKRAVALVVDSVTEAAWSARELRHLLELAPTLDLLVAILQVTKGGLPAGAMSLQHEADAHVAVDGMRWQLVKSRYQDTSLSGDVLPVKQTEAA